MNYWIIYLQYWLAQIKRDGLRRERKRYNREMEGLKHALRDNSAQMQALNAEISTMQSQLEAQKIMGAQKS